MSAEVNAEAFKNLLISVLIPAGAQSVSRRLLHWSDVPAVDQPAVFIAQGNETPTQAPSGLPPVWRAEYKVYIYVNETDVSIPPTTKLNLLLDALKGALVPNIAGQKQTLGGVVSHCWIAGAIETDEGTLGSQAMAVVPVEMLYS